MTDDLETAWLEVDAMTPKGWLVGRPSLHDDVRGAEHWEHWAYDVREKPKVGKRSREWTAVRADRG